MKSPGTKYLLLGLLFLNVAWIQTPTGCTSPMADGPEVPDGDRDKGLRQDTAYLGPILTLDLSEQVSETSGLILWKGLLWTMNDNTDTRIYGLDQRTGEIREQYILPGVVNRDWEEISQDDEYIYIGDFGNNMGNRTDLHILKIEKLSLEQGDPSIETIRFSYSDQEDFSAPGGQQTEFDCEAFVVSSDSIYLFSKQWLSGFTTQYSLPKEPGTYIAQKRETFDIGGQVTGSSYVGQSGILILSGYSGLVQPFLYVFYDFQDDNFFSGSKLRVNITLPMHQLEAVTTGSGLLCYISNESAAMNEFVKIPQRLHHIDLGELPEDLVKGLQEFD